MSPALVHVVRREEKYGVKRVHDVVSVRVERMKDLRAQPIVMSSTSHARANS